MLPEIERIRGEHRYGTLEAQRLAWPGVQLPGYRIQLFLGEAARGEGLLRPSAQSLAARHQREHQRRLLRQYLSKGCDPVASNSH